MIAIVSENAVPELARVTRKTKMTKTAKTIEDKVAWASTPSQ